VLATLTLYAHVRKDGDDKDNCGKLSVSTQHPDLLSGRISSSTNTETGALTDVFQQRIPFPNPPSPRTMPSNLPQQFASSSPPIRFEEAIAH